LSKSLTIGAGLSSLPLTKDSKINATPRAVKDDISLAQWALVKEIREGKWKTLEFPKIAREAFGIDGIEFVNTLFEIHTYNYLRQLKKNADDYGVRMVLIMVDNEGEPTDPSKKERMQAVINHRKWIDIAHYLGCHSIRTNCRPKNVSFEDGLKWAEESYNLLLEYAMPAKVGVLIENHGILSDDPDFIVALMKRVNNLYFGTLPDFKGSDPYTYVKKLFLMLPGFHSDSSLPTRKPKGWSNYVMVPGIVVFTVLNQVAGKTSNTEKNCLKEYFLEKNKIIALE